jgi:hypothetical protein
MYDPQWPLSLIHHLLRDSLQDDINPPKYPGLKEDPYNYQLAFEVSALLTQRASTS